MGRKEVLGEFEHHVLLAALRLGPDAYTATILSELEERTGREVSAAAIYIALRRLESSGLMSSDLRTDREIGDLRERRFVRVTERGLAMLRESRRRFISLWESLDAVLEVA